MAMTTRIRVSIKARGETQSPTVDDMLDQLRDYFDILRGVEEALAEDGASAIDWRIVAATTNSPLEFTAEASARHFATNVDQRAELVTRFTANGLQLLKVRGERPLYFTDKTMLKAERFFERVTNGLDETKIVYEGARALSVFDITPSAAKAAAANVRAALTPPDKPYKELGSVEGTPRTIGRDGFGRLVMWLKERLTGEEVKCILTGDAEEELGQHQIKEVWESRRLLVFGTLHYKGIGKLSQVDGTRVKFFRDSDLPDIEDILDENFTGGLSSEEYLKRLRDGELS